MSMDRPSAASVTLGVRCEDDTMDVHVRRDYRTNTIAFAAVYVRPNGPVNGYWFTSLDGDGARALWLAGVVQS
jgi:hypothetical protein